ncbi:hypothetical protein [Brucella sp. 2280]|uniref:hypothetical protein n=1 Tax=Brucella sp. 2280 TaxID=2592625 RepID=UPI00129636B5|nr:hypothetical protein [Brucella sp. 2280]QGA57495.1 hypothetical protein GHC20_10600 [Brucella sp. 2280]
MKSQIEQAVKLPRLLIVSSYHRACGIAQYIEFLELPLRNQHDFDVEIAAVPVELLRSQSPYARKAAQTAFRDLLKKAEAADIVNIQLEPGLFGFTPQQIWHNIDSIIKKSKRVIITYHTVPSMEAAKFSLSYRGLLSYLRAWRSDYFFGRLFAKIRKDPHKFHHIVQTMREARNFALMGIPKETISHRPLAFISRDARQEMRHQEAKEQLLSQLNIQSGTLLGCFGFLSKYKGIEIAIRAAYALPTDHHLVIVGGIHPEGLTKGAVEQSYTKKLINEIERLSKKSEKRSRGGDKSSSFKKRVHFLGALNNDEFNQVMLASDAVILPYAEVGQTSSGPAALALDLGRPLYCSRTRCFSELARYQPDMISFFEIGNYLELAEKLLLNDGDIPIRSQARIKYLESFSVEHRAACYFAAAKQLLRRK